MMEGLTAALILTALIVAFTNEAFQGRLGVSPMPSMRRVRRRMIALIPAEAKTIVELGSGWGGLARAAAKHRPQAAVTGMEYSMFPFLFSRLGLWLRPRPNLRFVRQDFRVADLSDADVVLCYLSNPIMARLRDTALRQLPSGAVILSSTFFLPDWEPERIETVRGLWPTRIFVYRKNSSEKEF